MTDRPLAGKTALVTGASRGIGRAIAQRLAADGAAIAVHFGSNVHAANETISAIQRDGGQAFPVHAELGSAGDIDTLFTALTAGLDGRPLDILVNNAAIASAAGTIDRATPELFDREFAINVRAPFFIIQRALPLLRDGGRIINISSGTTWFVTPQTVYSMTKGALNVLTRSLANNLGARGITVNTISPGMTDTDRTAAMRGNPQAAASISEIVALGRIGEPPDIADAVAFFASDDSRCITGQNLDVNGGLALGSSTAPWQGQARQPPATNG
jgi:3-oxoacyl-[acyl-carrier protein] reductase